ncbi:MAG: hypothetical protein JF606_01510 [Burkholderiales bacterium]|jgi:hypothetical protein|nr:hypothetical protein [Burkholderiales bacterium]
MEHDPNAMDEPTRNTSEAGPAITETDTDPSRAAADFIGYEAADPSLYEHFWSEVLQAHASTRKLR